ncbi:MAG: FeoA family protein [Sterolibacterium sp.]
MKSNNPNNHSLSDLDPGQEAVISAVHANEALHYRLAALGFRIGQRIQLMRRGRWAGPLHVRLGATDVMLRQAEADLIIVSAK